MYKYVKYITGQYYTTEVGKKHNPTIGRLIQAPSVIYIAPENQTKTKYKMETTEKKLVAKTGSVYGHGWRIMKSNFISLFLIALITMVLAIPLAVKTGINGFEDGHVGIFAAAIVFIQLFVLAYVLFVYRPIDFGQKWVYLKAVRKEKFEVTEIFDPFKYYLNVVLAALLSGAIVGFGFIFLIVPGIVFACRLAFVPYLVMDKKLDPVKAVEESWRLTRGQGWRIFWMGIVAFFIILLGLICFGIGVIISCMWINTAFASLYHVVLEEKGENVAVNGNTD